MKQVKILANHSNTAIEKDINKWLSNNKAGISVENIQLMETGSDSAFYTAMIIYRVI